MRNLQGFLYGLFLTLGVSVVLQETTIAQRPVCVAAEAIKENEEVVGLGYTERCKRQFKDSSRTNTAWVIVPGYLETILYRGHIPNKYAIVADSELEDFDSLPSKIRDKYYKNNIYPRVLIQRLGGEELKICAGYGTPPGYEEKSSQGKPVVMVSVRCAEGEIVIKRTFFSPEVTAHHQDKSVGDSGSKTMTDFGAQGLKSRPRTLITEWMSASEFDSLVSEKRSPQREERNYPAWLEGRWNEATQRQEFRASFVSFPTPEDSPNFNFIYTIGVSKKSYPVIGSEYSLHFEQCFKQPVKAGSSSKEVCQAVWVKNLSVAK